LKKLAQIINLFSNLFHVAYALRYTFVHLSILMLLQLDQDLFAQSHAPEQVTVHQKWIDSLGWTEIESDHLVWQETDQAWQFQKVKIKWKSISIVVDQMQVKIKKDHSIEMKATGHLKIKHEQGELEAGQLEYQHQDQVLLLSDQIKGHWLGLAVKAKQASLHLDPVLLEVQQIQLQFNLSDLIKQMQKKQM
jgi:hypothetical protein